MNKEQKVQDLIDNYIRKYVDPNKYEEFIRSLLYGGICGYIHMPDDLIDSEHKRHIGAKDHGH